MERLRELIREDDDGRRVLRAYAGLLLGAGLLLAFFRKASPEVFGYEWGDGAIFVLLVVIVAVFYGFGMVSRLATGETRPWQSIYIILGLLAIPVMLAQLVELISEGDSGNALNVVWISLVTAAAATAAAVIARVRFALLIAGLALILAWLNLWDEILSDGLTDLGTVRGLLGLVAIILLGLAFALRTAVAEMTTKRVSELVTAAGIAAILATVGLSSGGLLEESLVFGAPSVDTSWFWDLAGLAISLFLITFGARFGTRGTVYVGAIGLLLFLLVVGYDLDSDTPEGKILGWPLILIALGIGGVVASLLPGVKLGSAGIDRFEDSESGLDTGASATATPPAGTPPVPPPQAPPADPPPPPSPPGGPPPA